MPGDKRRHWWRLLAQAARRILRWLTAKDDYRLERAEDKTELKKKKAD
jgi:hypothetical protein